MNCSSTVFILVNNDQVHKMVASIGWNPFYKNEKRSFETHIIHEFPEDFYGADLSVLVCGYLRPEKNYDSLEALKGSKSSKSNLMT